MTAELERLKTTCLAQEAEIARLQAGFDDLRKCITENSYKSYEHYDEPDNVILIDYVIEEINRITGVSE